MRHETMTSRERVIRAINGALEGGKYVVVQQIRIRVSRSTSGAAWDAARAVAI
jgi:hypothetical protein